MGQEKLLDVSDLEAPEPLVHTLDEAETLQSGEYLRMTHRRDPCLLRGHLDQRGFGYVTRNRRDRSVQTFIWRIDDSKAETAARVAAEKNIS